MPRDLDDIRAQLHRFFEGCTNDFSVGLIATFINYGQNFVQPLRMLSNLYNTLQAALAAQTRPPDVVVATGGRAAADLLREVCTERFGSVDEAVCAGLAPLAVVLR